MSLSAFFITRRIGTCLLALGVVLLGAFAYARLPVSSLPMVDFPTIEIEADLPGASAQTMASSVATPLERSLSTIPAITQMTSSSSLGISRIVLQFTLDRNIDAAAQDVQGAINQAAGVLPKNLPNPPFYNKVNPADSAVLSLALTSPTLPLTELDRAAEDLVAQPISQMPGVGIVDFHGQLRPAIRVRVDPEKLASLGLTMEDIRSIIGSSTIDAPKGSLNGPHRAVVLDTSDQLLSAAAYRNLVVAFRNGAPIKLADLGAVVEAPEDVHEAAWFHSTGQPNRRAIIVDIAQQPGSNVNATIAGIKQRLPALVGLLPAAAELHIVGDRTQTIHASVHDVQGALLITIVLVVLVIFAFLRDLRATLIPSLTIPLSLLATFAAMAALGYGLDNISLMGLTIVVGFVVDDAIVVIENIIRHVEAGTAPLQAALRGSREVGFTILSMTISLIAVFLPVLLMGGLVGRLFREFAITVSIALVMSAIVSLSVTPMLCGWLIRSERDGGAQGGGSRGSATVFDAVTRWYGRALDLVLLRQRATLAVLLGTLAITGWLFSVIPKGFFPQVDTGFIIGTAKAAPDVSFEAMSGRITELADIAAGDPAVQTVASWIGANPTISQGRVQIYLTAQSSGRPAAARVMARLRRRMQTVEGITLGMKIRQDIQVGGRSSAAQFEYTLQGPDSTQLDLWAARLEDALDALPQLRDVDSDREASATRASLQIDRPTAARMGVSVQAIDDILYDSFGQRQVATLFSDVDQYHVIEEADPRYQLGTEALLHLFVRAQPGGRLVPLGLLVRQSLGIAPITINHQGLFPAITLSFNLAPGVALSQAEAAIRAAEQASGMPASISGTFQGSAKAFQDSLANEPWLIAGAIIAIYIVLGVLYESAIHPLTILSTLPSAGVGALLALMLCGRDLSIMGMIGMLLLIGIVKKNAILMIDFALTAQRDHGATPHDAIRQACLLRFRPIMMTSFAALFGALPLALGSNAGAELRQPLGIAIVGGLLLSQTLTLFTTPVVYLWFDRLRNPRGPVRRLA